MTTPEHGAPEGGRPVSEMLERIARAMCLASRPSSNPDDLTPAPRGRLGMIPKWRLYEHLALAAMKAMREPTPEMKQAIAHADWTGSKDLSWADGFTLMIDREISIAEGGKDGD